MKSFSPPEDDLRPDIDRIRSIRGAINTRLGELAPDRLERLDSQDLEDISRVMLMLECMLSKYQERMEMRRTLESLGGMMQEAADGISAIDEEIAEASSVSEMSYRRIREARLCMHSASNPADRESVRRILAETSPTIFTKTTRQTDSAKYQQSVKTKSD